MMKWIFFTEFFLSLLSDSKLLWENCNFIEISWNGFIRFLAYCDSKDIFGYFHYLLISINSYQMSKYSLDPTDFSRIQKFHELFGMILGQNWTSNMTSFKKSKIWHYFSLVMNVLINHSWKIGFFVREKRRKNSNISMILNWNNLVRFFYFIKLRYCFLKKIKKY